MEAPESQVEEKFFIYELGVLNANNEIIIHLQNMSKLAVQNCLSCLFILVLLVHFPLFQELRAVQPDSH